MWPIFHYYHKQTSLPAASRCREKTLRSGDRPYEGIPAFPGFTARVGSFHSGRSGRSAAPPPSTPADLHAQNGEP